ncbi:MAG: HU family DNA-binding protein [Planctomycetota bacterium]
MTKKEIVRTISEEVGLTQQQTKEIVQKTFDAIVEALVTHRRIELRNFGVFEVKTRAARKARNPKTGQQVMVPPKHVVSFKPGKVMEAKVLRLDHAAAENASSSFSNDSAHPGDTTQEPVGDSSRAPIRDARDLWR